MPKQSKKNSQPNLPMIVVGMNGMNSDGGKRKTRRRKSRIRKRR